MFVIFDFRLWSLFIAVPWQWVKGGFNRNLALLHKTYLLSFGTSKCPSCVCGWGRSIFNDGGSTWQRGRGEIVTSLLWVAHFLVWNHTGLKSQSRALSVVNKCYIGVYRGMVWQRQRERLYIINFCLCGVCSYSHVLMSVRFSAPQSCTRSLSLVV